MNNTRPIDADALIRDLIDNRNFYPVFVKCAIEQAPTLKGFMYDDDNEENNTNENINSNK